MRIGLIIASFGRPELVRQLLSLIALQVRGPDEIVLSVVSENDLEAGSLSNPGINVVYSSPGSCAQRNKGLEFLRDRVDVVLFIDDDFWMSRTYVRDLEQLFRQMKMSSRQQVWCWQMVRLLLELQSRRRRNTLKTISVLRRQLSGFEMCRILTDAIWRSARTKSAT